MNKQIAERISVCRIAMLMKMPFWGNLVTRLGVHSLEETDTWCSTAATDGRNIYYSEKFIEPLNDKQIVFVLCHEILHVVYDHLSRGTSHNPMLSNIAADFIVNQTIIDENIGEHIGDKISKEDLINAKNDPRFERVNTLYDPRYRDWSYERVYEDLLENEKELNDAMGSGDIYITLDHHIDGSGEGEDGKSGAPTLTTEEIQRIKDSIREALISVSQNVGISNVPGGVRRLLGDLLEPKMDWRQLLTAFVEAQVSSDYTYMRLGRRSFSSDCAIFPSKKKQPVVEIDIALDMSGSIGEVEVREFFTEIHGIMSQYEAYRISIMCFDTCGYNYQTFTQDDGDDIFEYELKGGGGTDFNGIFDYLKELEVVPKQLAVLTDGETYNWGDPDYCETLFVIKNSREIIAPFGTSVKYEA